jgi:hypothetical protein
MRYIWLVAVIILLVTGCNSGDDAPTPAETPTATAEATPTGEPEFDQDDGSTPEPESTPVDNDDDPADPEPQDLQAIIDQVARQVSELRGLEILEDLDVNLMTEDELRAFIEDELVVDPFEIELLWMLRLIEDREFDFEDMLIDMQVQEIQGFYIPETGELFVIAEDENLSPLKRVFLAHEIVHALQDQHFDLSRLEEYLPDRDRSMALRAMIEGDAVLTQELYVQEYLTTREQIEYLREAFGLLQLGRPDESMDQVPRYLEETLYFPYSAGLRFIMHAFDGDFGVVDEILQDPPQSTQQIMNAGAYLAGEIDDPIQPDMPPILERLHEDWEAVIDGSLGVLDLTIMLEENGVEPADDAFDGWRGTDFVMYAYEDHLLAVLATRWLTEDDAAEFERALVETMDGYVEEEGIWIGDGRYFTIVVNGNSVNLKSSTHPDALVDAAGLRQ